MKSPAHRSRRPADNGRRRFVKLTAATAGCIAVNLALPCCDSREPETADGGPALLPGGLSTFPLLEVRGSDYEIGFQAGRQFAGMIREGFEARGSWWTDLLAFAKAQEPAVYDTFLAAAKTHTPEVLEELRGWAEGSGVPIRELMVFNLKCEYEALRGQSMDQQSGPAEENSGCSCLARASGDQLLVAHNEDGNKAYAERMFLLRMYPAGRPTVFAVSYPGVLPGNAPWVNSRGVMMTTNYIPSQEVKLGVGRYFLDRQAMAAGTVDEVVDICSHTERAYAFHHIIGSKDEKRLLGLEATPSKLERREIKGLYMHTNHLVLPTMAGEPQIDEYVAGSSMSRWQVLTRWQESLAEDAVLGADEFIAVLSSHENRPYSPCRHPEESVDGATLLNALFDLGTATLRIHKGNPCRGVYTDYPFQA
jgi:isopenicillin-N N-acyltransferase-like protein